MPVNARDARKKSVGTVERGIPYDINGGKATGLWEEAWCMWRRRLWMGWITDRFVIPRQGKCVRDSAVIDFENLLFWGVCPHARIWPSETVSREWNGFNESIRAISMLRSRRCLEETAVGIINSLGDLRIEYRQGIIIDCSLIVGQCEGDFISDI